MSAAAPALAVRTFLPFCRALLSGQRPPAPPARLPLRDPDALTAEVVAGIADMANKAVTRWLLRELGWRRRDIIDPDDDEAVTSARLWDPAAWGGLALRFSDESVDVLLGLWNLHATPTQRRDADLGALRRLRLSASGDLLLGHLAERSFVRAGADLSGGTGNPLSQLAWGHLCHTDTARLGRLLEADVLPLMPWISAAWPAGWRRRWGHAVRTPLAARQTFAAQAARWGRWATLASEAGRGDLLVPLIEGYADQLRRFEADRRALAARLQGARHADQQPLWDAWADALAPLAQVHQAWKRAHGRHPVEREAADKLLLAGAAALDLRYWVARAARATATLRGEIG